MSVVVFDSLDGLNDIFLHEFLVEFFFLFYETL